MKLGFERGKPCELHLKCGGEEVVLGHNVHKEVRRDFSQLMVEYSDETQIQILPVLHGLLRAAQQSQQAFPVLKSLINIPNEETNERKLQLSYKRHNTWWCFMIQYFSTVLATRFLYLSSGNIDCFLVFNQIWPAYKNLFINLSLCCYCQILDLVFLSTCFLSLCTSVF